MRMLALPLVASVLFAQGVSLGLRAGIPITPMLTGNGRPQVSTQRYTIGPLIEVHLWHGAALGADFLLQRTELAIPAAESSVWRWEAPITVIYRFRAPTRVFVRTGVSFNRVFDVGGATECV